MSYSLYRCGDDTYVAVAESMSPPLPATRAYGLPMRVRALPKNVDGSLAWRRAALRIAESMFVVIHADDVDDMFVLR
jgi:hypothetical protein